MVVTIVIYKKIRFINLDDCMNTIRWIVVVTIVIYKKTGFINLVDYEHDKVDSGCDHRDF